MASSLSSRRLFFALGLSNEAKSSLAHWLQHHVIADKAFTQPRNWHLTLLFLGNTPLNTEAALIKEVRALQLRKFNLKVADIDWWPSNGIFHLRPISPPDALFTLHNGLKEIAQKHHIEDPHRRYRPHITLARNCKAMPTVAQPMPAFDMQVHSFTLFESTRDEQGLVYRPIEHFTLY
ncbi:RNA 2',3'-cyclic phosphodiesterase [Pseudoalteromonas ruthenica]|uniref:RNA 2',3'-cyclic phosphodiesterase n=1 Tax=Pseudoalteromonas ruthenica TaxID=151081 RepID=UPI00241DED06|nr:RNA 2',3'-cyclic phosphodiesterase [Pseudoalteromonas ruthenica]|tara:strand:+ start:66950 stop:67483 length:534 start_codon:yes stop_codon:yes gene_type:complete